MGKYEGVEYENPNAIGYQLDDWEIDKFLELKDELLETDDLQRAAEIRKEMADILGDEYKNKVANRDEEENEQEEDILATMGVLKSDLESRIMEYAEKQREILTYSDGEDTMPDRDKREYERINNVTPMLKDLLTKNPDFEYVSIEDIDMMIEEYTVLRREIWQDVVNSGNTATSKQESDLVKYDDIVKELQDLKERCKKIEDKNNTKAGKEEKDKDNDEKDNDNDEKDEEEPKPKPDFKTKGKGYNQPEPLDKLNLNVTINVKTGECILTDGTVDEKGNLKEYRTEMDSFDYTKDGLKAWKKTIQSNEKIPGKDWKYLDAVDPTLYNAYLEWEKINGDKYEKSPAELYVKSVIEREKNLENGLEPEGETVPGKVKISYKKPKKEENPKKNNFKGISGLFAMARAKKILNHHGPKGLDLAEIEKDRRLLKGLLAGLLISGGAAALLLGGNPETEQKPQNETKTEKPTPTPIPDKDIDEDKDINDDIVDKTVKDDEQKEDPTEDKGRIYVGDIIDIELYSSLYKSADAPEPSGAVGNASQTYGVNKIACVIGGKTYSTATHSADEIYEMAENAGVQVDYHIDKTVIINGKACVEVHEVGNPAATYIYNDNGVAKYSDGREFNSDVEYGLGWMKDGVKGTKEMPVQTANTSNKDSNSKQVDKDDNVR